MRTTIVLVASVVGVVGLCLVVWALVGRPSAPVDQAAYPSPGSDESSSTAPARRRPPPPRPASPDEAEVRTSLLRGRITRGDDGTPVKERDVQIVARPVLPGEEVGDHSTLAFARTDGRFAFPTLEPGRDELWIHSNIPTLRDVRRRVSVGPAHDETPVEVVLEPRAIGHLRLRVVGPDGRPTEKVNVCALEDLGGGYVEATALEARALGNGVLQIVLEAGPHRVAALRTGFRSEPPVLRLTIEEGETLDREVRLRAETVEGGK